MLFRSGRGLGGSLLDGCGKRKVKDDRLVGVVVVFVRGVGERSTGRPGAFSSRAPANGNWRICDVFVHRQAMRGGGGLGVAFVDDDDILPGLERVRVGTNLGEVPRGLLWGPALFAPLLLGGWECQRRQPPTESP